MNEPGSGSRYAEASPDARGPAEKTSQSICHEYALARALERDLEAGSVDLRQAVRWLARSSTAAVRRVARLERFKQGLIERDCQAAARLEEIAARVAELERAINVICTLLKEIDDPYGLGQSLDERLALDGADHSAEEEA
jgi:hypothetical protein